MHNFFMRKMVERRDISNTTKKGANDILGLPTEAHSKNYCTDSNCKQLQIVATT